MPWIHFHVGERGQVNACCVANIPYGNVNQSSFDDIWNGEAINDLRSKFSVGKADPRCTVCLNREKGGASSIRLETFEKYGREIPDRTRYPRYFDIRFSNVCNFRCRTCWHRASSKWFNDAVQLKRQASKQAIIKNIKDLDRFLFDFGDALLFAEEIYFAGGEPLVTNEHYLLLEWLIEQKVFPRLRYNTNFSILRFKDWDIIELWSNFKDVEVLASIDAHEQLGEYIRKELDWELFLSNIERLKAGAKHVNIKIAPTISMLNIMAIPSFYDYCLEQEIIDPDDWYINLLERPYYYNIRALPQSEKKKVRKLYEKWIEKKENDKLSKTMIKAMSEILTFMESEDLSKHYSNFQKETNILDKIRDEEYSRVRLKQ